MYDLDILDSSITEHDFMSALQLSSQLSVILSWFYLITIACKEKPKGNGNLGKEKSI